MKHVAIILFVVGCSFSALADKAPSELKIIQTSRAKKIKEIDAAYVQALEKLKIKYKKRGDWDAVNAIQAELDMFDSSKAQEKPNNSSEEVASGVKSDSNFAEIDARGSKSRLELGEKAFPNGSRWATLPDQFKSGWKIQKRGFSDKSLVKIEVRESGFVVLFAGASETGFPKKEWERIGHATTDGGDKLHIYKKYYYEGSELEFTPTCHLGIRAIIPQ